MFNVLNGSLRVKGFCLSKMVNLEPFLKGKLCVVVVVFLNKTLKQKTFKMEHFLRVYHYWIT